MRHSAATPLRAEDGTGRAVSRLMVRAALLHGLGVGALGAALVGCSAASEADDTGQRSEDELAAAAGVGPLEAGVYDGDQGMLLVRDVIDRQLGTLVANTNKGAATCRDSTIALRNGRPTFLATECGDVTLRPAGDGGSLAVSGILVAASGAATYSDTFRRRRDGALVGTYADERLRLIIEASTEDRLTYSLMVDDQPFATHRVLGRTGPNAGEFSDPGWNDGCRIRLSVQRRDRRYSVSVSGEAKSDAVCPQASSLASRH